MPEKPNFIFRKPWDLRSVVAPSKVQKVKGPLDSSQTVWTSIFDQKGSYIVWDPQLWDM